jgi:hypothetical protein
MKLFGIFLDFVHGFLKNSFLKGRRFSAPVAGGKYLAAPG